jgi:rhamnulokinase
MDDALFIAVDLGAGSGRVFLCGAGPDELRLEEIRRFHYPPRECAGHLRWDFTRILNEIKTGLYSAGKRTRELGQCVRSIGVASWGVDYGFVDATGKLLEDPICYRDSRAQGVMEEVFARITKQELFTRTGLQLISINTLFQLYAHACEGIPREAHRLLLIPDLVNLSLTGRAVTEYTNATTTQMINVASRTWDTELLNRLDLPVNLMPEMISAGDIVGPLCLPEAVGLENTTVLAPATHDTGSAVVGAPLEEGWAFISSGTWSLVGVERDTVLIDSRVFAHNFTNEGGAFGTIRFLKNLTGLWILESCRSEWRDVDAGYDKLLARLAAIDGYPALIFPDDERFFKPTSMLGALAEQMSENNQRVPDDPITMTKVILDSLAFRYASILKTIESLTGQRIRGVQIVGGGSRNDYLNQMTANATNLPVVAGPVEATVIGNVLVQGIAAGRFSSLADGRQYVASRVKARTFTPCVSDALLEAVNRYAQLEEQYTKSKDD